MRMTLRRYLKSKAMLEELKKREDYVKKWKIGIEDIGDVGNKIVTAFNIDERGKTSNVQVDSPTSEVMADHEEA